MAKRSLSGPMQDHIPQLPVYRLQGKEQPPAFSKGVLAALQVIEDADDAAIDGARDPLAEKSKLTERLCIGLEPLVASGGDYGRGALAMVCEYLAYIRIVGRPILGRWTPFWIPWSGGNGEIPPDGCLFFDVNGVACSVDRALVTLKWRAVEDPDDCDIKTIRRHGRPITREQFEALREKRGAAIKALEAAAPSTQFPH